MAASKRTKEGQSFYNEDSGYYGDWSTISTVNDKHTSFIMNSAGGQEGVDSFRQHRNVTLSSAGGQYNDNMVFIHDPVDSPPTVGHYRMHADYIL